MKRHELLVGALQSVVGFALARIGARAKGPAGSAERKPRTEATNSSPEIYDGKKWIDIPVDDVNVKLGEEPNAVWVSLGEIHDVYPVITIPWFIARDQDPTFLPEVRNAQ